MDSITDIPAAPIANATCSRNFILTQANDDKVGLEERIVLVQNELDQIRSLLQDLDEDDTPEDAYKHLREAESVLQDRLGNLLTDGKGVARRELLEEGLDDELVD